MVEARAMVEARSRGKVALAAGFKAGRHRLKMENALGVRAVVRVLLQGFRDLRSGLG